MTGGGNWGSIQDMNGIKKDFASRRKPPRTEKMALNMEEGQSYIYKI